MTDEEKPIIENKEELDKINRIFLGAIAASIFGFVSWLIPFLITSRPEPWDWSIGGYILLLVSAGFFAGLIAAPYRSLTIYLGVWFGQVVAVGFLPGSEKGWFLLGVFTTATSSIVALIGMPFGALLRNTLFSRKSTIK